MVAKRIPRLTWTGILLVALFGWVGYRCWDYYGRPLTEAEIKTASPDRLAMGLGTGPLRDKVAAKLLDSGPAGWKALVRSLRSPDPYTRRQAAQSLATLRYLNLEGGIAAVVNDDDKLAYGYKIAALASNGSRKSMPIFAEFAQAAGKEKHLSASQQMAADRLADLMASVNTPEALQVLLDLAPSGHPSVLLALADFTDPKALAALDAGRRRMDWGRRLTAELRAAGDPDPGIVALAQAIKGDPRPLHQLSAAQLSALARAVQVTWLQPKTPAYAALLTGTFLANYSGAVAISATQPDPGVAEFGELLAAQPPKNPTEQESLDLFERLNGLKQGPMSNPPRLTEEVLALERSDPAGAAAVIRAQLQKPPKAFFGREQACLTLVKLAQDPATLDLVSRHIFPREEPPDPVFIETVLRMPDGEATVLKMIAATDPVHKSPLPWAVSLAKVDPSLVTPALRQAVVAACAEVEWQQIGQLNPTWAREFGSDDLKEKYAVLLGNNRYLGRIRALRLFAASGHKLIGDELKLTSGRGLLDELVACIEVVGENNLVDQLPFVLARVGDGRWRVREAVAYALRQVTAPEAITALETLKKDPVPAVALTATSPVFMDFHRQLNRRQQSEANESNGILGGGMVPDNADGPRVMAMPGPARMNAKP